MLECIKEYYDSKKTELDMLMDKYKNNPTIIRRLERVNDRLENSYTEYQKNYFSKE